MARRVQPPPLSKLELLEVLQCEFKNLKRQQSALENDCLCYKNEARALLDKQKGELDFLEKKEEELACIVKTMKCETVERRNKREDMTIKTLLKKQDMYKCLIRNETINMEGVETRIRQQERKRYELELKQIESNPNLELLRLLRSNAILTNRLDIAIKRFNRASAENAGLREEINGLLNEREMFEKIQKCLAARMSAARTTLDKMVEDIKVKFSESEESYSKMKILEERNKHSYRNGMEIIIANSRLLKSHKDLATFLEQRSKQRGLTTLAVKLEEKEAEVKREMERRMRDCSAILKAVRLMKNQDDLQEILQIFDWRERKTFGVFIYSNVLNGEIDMLSKKLKELHDDIETTRSDQITKRRACEKKLEKENWELINAQIRTRGVKMRLDKTEQILPKLLKGLDELFNILQCKRSFFTTMLGESKRVNEYNYKLYLEIMEKMLIGLINKALFVKPEGEQLRIKPNVVRSKSKSPKRSTVYRKPSFMPFLDFKDDDMFVLPNTREEVLRRAQKIVQKNQIKFLTDEEIIITHIP